MYQTGQYKIESDIAERAISDFLLRFLYQKWALVNTIRVHTKNIEYH